MTMLINIGAWIVIGFIAGFAASRLVDDRGERHSWDIALGMAGALIGGWIFNAAGSVGFTGFNIWSLIVAVVSAVMCLVVWNAFRRSTTHLLNPRH
jgi:uncharacterized membrane protein YeaQ/YmgE (transglycosylase-associated protein family)